MYLFSDTIVCTFPEAVYEEFLPSIAVEGIVVAHQTRKRWSRRSHGDGQSLTVKECDNENNNSNKLATPAVERNEC